jgi:hypothetical protein
MALFNYATKEVTLKIVYYGPGLSGKTTNLQYLHSVIEPEKKGKLISLATEADRTLFFDFMPVELGRIRDFSIRFQLYTVPGQVRYNATRKLVLKGADAVVFVADSQRKLLQENLQSLENMRENLRENNIDPDDIPVVMQYNKRDLPDIMSVDELNSYLNKKGYPYFEAVAIEGKGVRETFQEITRLLLKHISKKHKIDLAVEEEKVSKDIVMGAEEELVTARIKSEEIEPTRAIDARVADEEILKLLNEIKDSLQRVESAVNYGREFNTTLEQLRMSIEDMRGSINENTRKQDEILKILRDIKNSIDNAKKKKRWLFFG